MGSKLHAFLKPAYTEQTQEFTVSKRFQGEDGKPVAVTLKSITQDVNESLVKKSTKTKKTSGAEVEIMEKSEYQARLIVTCVSDPDFTDGELCKTYGVVDPLLLPAKMFTPGEYSKLLGAIMAINGFKDDDETEKEAKNS